MLWSSPNIPVGPQNKDNGSYLKLFVALCLRLTRLLCGGRQSSTAETSEVKQPCFKM